MPQWAFAASGGSLLNRVRRLLGVPAGEEMMNARQIGGLALLGIGLLFVLAGVYLNLATPMYRATARIKVDRDTSAQLGSENGKVTLTMGDPYFAQTVVEVIRSEAVLRPVVSSLGLSDEWGKRYHSGESSERTAEVMGLLKARLAVRAVPNSIFFEISCLSEKPEEASTIANAVAEAYRYHRYQERQETSHVALRTMEDRLKEQEERVHKAQAEVDRLRVELGIPQEVTTENPTSATAENAPTFLLTAETLRKLEGMRIELDAQVMREETLLDSLKATPRDKLVYSLPTASPDATLTSLVEQKNLAEQALIIKQKDFGDEHPEVVRLKSQLEDLNTKINNQVDGILLGLDSRVSAVRQQLNKLKNEVENARQNDIAFVQKSRPYFEAKRNLGEAERFSQVLAMKIASENVEAALPKSATVQVMDPATVPLRPVYPNRAQAAALIVFGILLDFGGLRMLRAKPRLTPVLQPG
jgi:succinoglycan biosynthesis transport protein ExoP